VSGNQISDTNLLLEQNHLQNLPLWAWHNMDEGYARDCGASGCSISTIANYIQRAGDGRVSATHVAEAVRFLVHFLGNVTQPGHDEALALGGNNIKVAYQGFSDNLHADWDTYMPGLDARGRQVVGHHPHGGHRLWGV
jgi:hypothetical protein